jgi:porin
MSRLPFHVVAILTALACFAGGHFARAQDPAPAGQSTGVSKDPREALADAGIQFSATYIGEILGNVSGGMRTGVIYTGRLDLGTMIDLEKVAGWTGATFQRRWAVAELYWQSDAGQRGRGVTVGPAL